MTMTKEQAQQITFFNKRVLNWKYLGPTTYRCSRVKIMDPRFKQSVTLEFDYSYNKASTQAVQWLLERGWNVTGVNEDTNTIILGNWDSNQQLKGE